MGTGAVTKPTVSQLRHHHCTFLTSPQPDPENPPSHAPGSSNPGHLGHASRTPARSSRLPLPHHPILAPKPSTCPNGQQTAQKCRKSRH
ncbi:hypothetical protein BCR34DRAFT_306718 [Clohesyomyces aquaticus]|uniref:Uncharacterized protein n=1 Tax=Clohesyomyces aquaticus TaxID=1231657 RepID=A0A1Y1ZPT1_9PLEO|nr:hypothetical protein BCR34DRAFT_306718 [Clohesyomyces aquaticus]